MSKNQSLMTSFKFHKNVLWRHQFKFDPKNAQILESDFGKPQD